MKSKSVAVLSACCFFVAALSFILFAVSMEDPWLIVAVIALIFGVLLRKVFPAASLTRHFLEQSSGAAPDSGTEMRRSSKGQ